MILLEPMHVQTKMISYSDKVNLHIFHKKRIGYAVDNFSSFLRGQARLKIAIKCFGKKFLTAIYSGDISAVKNKTNIKRWF